MANVSPPFSDFPVLTATPSGYAVGWTSPLGVMVALWEPVTRKLFGKFANFALEVAPVQVDFTTFGSLASVTPPWGLQSTGSFVSPLGSSNIDLSLSIAGHGIVQLYGYWIEAPNFALTLVIGTARAVPLNRTRMASGRIDIVNFGSADLSMIVQGGVDEAESLLFGMAAFQRSTNTWLELVCLDPLTNLPMEDPPLMDSTIWNFQGTVRVILAGIGPGGFLSVWSVDSLRHWSHSRAGLQGLSTVRCSEMVPTNDAPRAFPGHSIALYGTKLIVLGGYGDIKTPSGDLLFTADDDIFAFSLLTQNWLVLPRLGGSAGYRQLYPMLFGTSLGLILGNFFWFSAF